MKIAFDGSAFWETGMTYEEQYDTVARAGYEYINHITQTSQASGSVRRRQRKRCYGTKRRLQMQV